MPQYKLILHKNVLKELEKIKHERKRILRKLDEVVKDHHSYLQRLSGYPCHKVRIGNYRAIIKIVEDR